MQKALAQYLFTDETLYQFAETKPLVKQENAKTKIDVAAATPEVKPVTKAPEPQESNQAPNKQIVTNDSSKESTARGVEPQVFIMDTPVLLVTETISEDEKEFLAKILGAVNLSFSKTDLLITSSYKGAGFKEIIYANKVRYILFFGQNSGGDFLNKLSLSKYQQKEIKQINFLYCDDLETIGQNLHNEKRLLWDAIKKLFS